MTARFTSTHVAEDDIVVIKVAFREWRGPYAGWHTARLCSEWCPHQRQPQFGAPPNELGSMLEYQPGKTMYAVWPFVYGPMTSEEFLRDASYSTCLVRIRCVIPKGTPYMRACERSDDVFIETLLPRDLRVDRVHEDDEYKLRD